MGIGIVDLLLVAVALSMDAFAVAVSSGIVSDSPNWKKPKKNASLIMFLQPGESETMPLETATANASIESATAISKRSKIFIRCLCILRKS